MFGFLQKHHNSQLQNETSATAVSVVLVECNNFFPSSVADVALKARSLHEHKQERHLYKTYQVP